MLVLFLSYYNVTILHSVEIRAKNIPLTGIKTFKHCLNQQFISLCVTLLALYFLYQAFALLVI